MNLLLANTYLSGDDSWTIWAIVFASVAFCIYLEQNFKIAAKIGGPVLVLFFAIALSTLNILPKEAGVYDVVQGYFVPVAIPLLLFRANVFHILRITGKAFVAFHISIVGTIIGAIVGSIFLKAYIAEEFAAEVPRLAGIMTASYSGGSVNFFAVNASFKGAEAINAGNGSTLLIADNIIMAGMFLFLLMLSSSKLLMRTYPCRIKEESTTSDASKIAANHWKRKEIALIDLAKAIAVAVGIAAVSHAASIRIIPGEPESQDPPSVDAEQTVDVKAEKPEKVETEAEIAARKFAEKAKKEPPFSYRSLLGNKYVLITFFSLLVATLFHKPMTNIHGSDELGGLLLYTFFFVIGAPADLTTIRDSGPILFVFCTIIAVVNLIFTLGVGKLLRQNLEDLLLSVNASLGGPPSAAAMAIGKGWENLVLPAILIGIWGYVIGTALGLFTTHLIEKIL